MLKEILQSLSKDGITVNELLKKFELDKDELQDKINFLIHMGYLELEKIDEPEKSISCKSCPHLEQCLANLSKINTYILTEKGKKLIDS